MEIITHCAVLFATLCSFSYTNGQVNNQLKNPYLDNIFSHVRELSRFPPSTANGTGTPLKVFVSMYIIDVTKKSDVDLDFTIQAYFRRQWKDERLKFEGDEHISLPIEQLNRIWNPDLFFVGEKEGKLHTLAVPNMFFKVWKDGTLFTSMRLSLTLQCGSDLRYFPHDTLTCHFEIESYGYHSGQIDLNWKDDNPVGISDSLSKYLPGYNVVGISNSKLISAISFGNYSRLVVQLQFQRAIGFFLTKLYIPYIIIVMISWLSFYIKPEYLALRLSLLLAILFIMFALSSEMNTYTPLASYTKGIDVWTGFCISLVFTSFLQFLFVSQFEKEEQKQRQCINGDAGDTQQLELGSLEQKEISSSKVEILSKTERAQQLCTGKLLSARTDVYFRYTFPIIFVVFNVIYWSVYL